VGTLYVKKLKQKKKKKKKKGLDRELRVARLLEGDDGDCVELLSLSCDTIQNAAAIAVLERDSVAGQVLLLAEFGRDAATVPTMQLVDLATGVCKTQVTPALLNRPYDCFAWA
jgi:hypothetical protein